MYRKESKFPKCNVIEYSPPETKKKQVEKASVERT